jgi:hypothetical protein
MGINQGNDQLFVNVSKGLMWYGKKDSEGHRKSCRAITGFVRSVAIEDDEYQGQHRDVVIVNVEDPDAAGDDKKMRLKFTLMSWFGQGFASRFKRIDFSKPLTIGVSGAEGGNEKVSFCWMKQSGETIPADKENWPMPQKVKVNGKETTDWGPMAERFKALLAEYKAKPPAVTGAAPTGKDDDLPF